MEYEDEELLRRRKECMRRNRRWRGKERKEGRRIMRCNNSNNTNNINKGKNNYIRRNGGEKE